MFHPWHEWECFKNGFYASRTPSNYTPAQARKMYAAFLKDTVRFRKVIKKVFKQWPMSCEHFLTDPHINRIAWLGQASMCIETKIPSIYRGGFFLLTSKQQRAANETAREMLERWVNAREN